MKEVSINNLHIDDRKEVATIKFMLVIAILCLIAVIGLSLSLKDIPEPPMGLSNNKTTTSSVANYNTEHNTGNEAF
jgi:hypothetical protein